MKMKPVQDFRSKKTIASYLIHYIHLTHTHSHGHTTVTLPILLPIFRFLISHHSSPHRFSFSHSQFGTTMKLIYLNPFSKFYDKLHYVQNIYNYTDIHIHIYGNIEATEMVFA